MWSWQHPLHLHTNCLLILFDCCFMWANKPAALNSLIASSSGSISIFIWAAKQPAALYSHRIGSNQSTTTSSTCLQTRGDREHPIRLRNSSTNLCCFTLPHYYLGIASLGVLGAFLEVFPDRAWRHSWSHRFSCWLPATAWLKESVYYYSLYCLFIQVISKTFWWDINWMKTTARLKFEVESTIERESIPKHEV